MIFPFLLQTFDTNNDTVYSTNIGKHNNNNSHRKTYRSINTFKSIANPKYRQEIYTGQTCNLQVAFLVTKFYPSPGSPPNKHCHMQTNTAYDWTQPTLWYLVKVISEYVFKAWGNIWLTDIGTV